MKKCLNPGCLIFLLAVAGGPLGATSGAPEYLQDQRLFTSVYARAGTVPPVQPAAQQSVTGQVTDEQGQPLPGVSITVRGTDQGTSTDQQGRYSLSLPDEPDVLVFSLLGFVTREVEVGSRQVVDITLAQDVADLEEVVVVGYGTQKRGDITGAIAQFDTEKLTERPLPRVDNALIGQMAGVRVQQTSGVPGAGFSIQIRGTGSISASNQPLYVIDGFPLEVSGQNSGGGFSTGNPLDNINPNDIESVEVLKDASAAAIYGSRASNGVVLVTTKKGQEGRARIGFNLYTGWNETVKKLDVLNGEEWIDRASEMIDAAWVASGPGRTAGQTSEEREAILGGFDRELIKDDRWAMEGYPGLQLIDWQDEIFRRGLVQNYQLTASGGTEFVKYFVSGDFLDQNGIAVGLNYKRYSARANVEVQATENLSIGLNLNPSYSVAVDPGVEGKDQQMHYAVTHVPVSEANVGLNVNIGEHPPYTWGNSRPSPLRVIEHSTGETKLFRTLGTIYADYRIIPGLNLRSTINLDHADEDIKDFIPAFVSGSPGNRQAFGRFRGYRRQTFVNENTLSYSNTFGGIHNLSAVAGMSYNTTKFDNLDIQSADGFPTDIVPTLNAANNINAGNTFTNETRNVLISWFSRVQYNLDDKYLLTASIRTDGSSRFGTDTKWGVFPSVSAGWRLSGEGFMQEVRAVSDLKLRASWGVAGNNGLGGDYGHIALLGEANYSFGGNQRPGYIPGNSPNPNLSWEEAETINFGLDMGLLDNRIFTSLDIYTINNRDLLLEIPVPSASGFTNALTNIGMVRNYGWELELTTRNFTGEFSWHTNLNLTRNRNKVIRLGPDNAPILGGDWDINHNILMVGEPMYSLYLVQQTGILSQEDIDNGAALFGNQVEGDPMYLDANGDGVIDPNDRVLSGHPNPDYIWGISNTFSYKGFDLNILVQGQWGGKMYSTFGRAIDRTGQGFVDNALGFYRDRWRSPEDPGAGRRGKAYSTFGRIKNTDWLYPSDYWRIRNITLGYDLGRVISNGPFTSSRIYVTAENFFGNDQYDGGFNPEAINNAGDDYGAFPLARSVIFGINVTF